MPVPERLDLCRFIAIALVAITWMDAHAQGAGPDELLQQTFVQIVNDVASGHDDLEHDVPALHALVRRDLYWLFDFHAAAQAIVTERFWPGSEMEQKELAEGLGSWLVAGYGDLLIFFNKDTFRMRPLNEDIAGQDLVWVDTVVTLNNGDEVDAAIKMAKTSDGWRIVDVVANNHSYVATYRDKFLPMLVRGGPEELLSWFKRRTADLRASAVDRLARR